MGNRRCLQQCQRSNLSKVRVVISIFKPFCSAWTNENVSTPLQHRIRVFRNSSVQHVDVGTKLSDVDSGIYTKARCS